MKSNLQHPFTVSLADRASIIALISTSVALSQSALAATKSWSDTAPNTLWANAANWIGGIPANDLTTDIALFNQTTYTNQPNVGNRQVAGIAIGDGSTATAPLTITTNGGATRLGIGASGIDMKAASGAVTLGVASNHGAMLGASQTWNNDSSSLLTVRSVGNFNTATAAIYTLTLSGSGSGGILIDNVIADSTTASTGVTALTVNQSGSGSVILAGANTYSGGTTVSNGTLLATNTAGSATGSGSVGISAGAVLGGSGIIGGAVTINSSAVISPGNNGAGNLTLNNGLTLAGTYSWDLGALSTASPATDFDRITLTSGNATITDSSLNLNLGAFAPSADPFWESNQTWAGILNNTGLIGTLTGGFTITNNQSSWSSLGSFTTTNTGNDVNLVWTAVPEPSSALAGLLIASGFLRRRRA